MKPLEIDKPIIGQRTQIGRAFDEILKDMPIRKWDWEQKQRKLKGKL